MDNLSDQELLRQYADGASEDAFAELLRRYVDLVYSAAFRMVRDRHLAEDVTQGAFMALARSARKVADHPVLSGWLHRTTQNLAVKIIRSEARRRAREQEAAAMNESVSAQSDANWEQIAPHLDDALGELSELDRDAILLRYFQRKSAREMAETLGTSEEAAQKRVSRAVERMRELFAKRGVAVGAGGLMVVLSAHAVQAAPVGLSASINASALTGSGFSIAQLLTAKTAAIVAGSVVLGTGAFFALESKVVPSPAAPANVPAGATSRPLAGFLSGIVKTLDGQPLAKAEVFLSTAFVPVQVYGNRSPKTVSSITGPDGRFAFPEDQASRAVIVLHEKGYGQATVAELAKQPDLWLQTWAHIEGTLRQGRKALANQPSYPTRRTTRSRPL